MAVKALDNCKSRKCILCRDQFLDLTRPYHVKDTEEIQKCRDNSIDSLWNILFKPKSQENTETDEIKGLLRNAAYCRNCRESVWEVDHVGRMIREFESQLENLTTKIISDLTENNQKSKSVGLNDDFEITRTTKKDDLQNQLCYDETVRVIFNALNLNSEEAQQEEELVSSIPTRNDPPNPVAAAESSDFDDAPEAQEEPVSPISTRNDPPNPVAAAESSDFDDAAEAQEKTGWSIPIRNDPPTPTQVAAAASGDFDDAAEVQTVSSSSFSLVLVSSLVQKYPECPQRQAVASDLGNAADEECATVPPPPLTDLEDFPVEEEDEEEIDEDDSDEDFVVNPEEQYILENSEGSEDNAETENDENSETKDLESESTKNELKTATRTRLMSTRNKRKLENGNEFGAQIQTAKRQKKKIEIKQKGNVQCTETSCHRFFKDELCMQAHVRNVHLGLNPFHCHQCNKDVSSLYHLRTHLMHHEGVRHRYKCSLPNCTKTFSWPNSVKYHILSTHSSKTYSQVCPICSKGFDTSENLEAHSVIHKGQNPFKCEDCPKAFSNSGDLSIHVKTHHQNPRQHSCSICKKRFLTLKYIKDHKRVMHPDIPLKCPLCDKKFLNGVKLKRHKETHFPKKTYKCHFCGKLYTTARRRMTHMNLHTGEKPYKCKLCFCGKRFARPDYLKKHETNHSGIKMNLHTGEKLYKCKFCGKRFARPDYLKKHETNHSGIKTHVCLICEKNFSSKQWLVNHEKKCTTGSLLYNGENPFICTDCPKKFTNSADLSKHVKTSHQSLPQHLCSICGKSFVTLKKLRSHKTYVHPDITGPLKCSICKEKFLKIGEFRKHRETHLPKKVLQCYFCGKLIKSVPGLSLHIKSHMGEKTYKCKLCRKRFIKLSNLKAHEKCHSGVKTDICSICGKAFSTRAYLMQHEKNHNIKNKSI